MLEQLIAALNLSKIVKLPNGTEVDLTTIPDLDKILSQAASNSAKTEKEKLYSQMAQATQKNNELLSELESLKQKLAAQSTQNTPPTSTPANNPPAATPPTQDIYKGFQDLLSQNNTEVLNAVQNALKPIMEKQQALEKQSIEEYRMKKIAELGSDLIPELVSGNTKEEIDASILNSIEIKKKYIPTPPAASPPPVPPAPVPTPTPTPPSAAPAPPPAPPAAPTPTGGNSLVDQVKTMSAADYAKNREKLMEELKSTVV